MFSPTQSSTPATTRVRTRRRPLSNGSIAQPKAKRQRLTDETFVAPDGPEMEETKTYRAPTIRKESVPQGPQREVALRSKKPRSGDRVTKGDGSILLTTNETYNVSKLLALPDRLRADTTIKQHGAIYSDRGYALTLTSTHAIVWAYAENVYSPETFEFDIPAHTRRSSDPLPLGSLVSPSASSSDPGLVVVVPATGKITYWDSISSAATMDLRMQRTGVEMAIPGLYSGEKAIDILNAEPAGFILCFSSGRIAYMSVRDGHGRPAIAVQFLRGSMGSSSGGLFGSLRHALSSSPSQGNIAAVRAARPGKVSERNVVVASTKGKIQSWDIHRGGHAALYADIEIREKVVMAIKKSTPSLSNWLLESFEVHDLTYIPKPIQESHAGSPSGVEVLVLVSLADREKAQYFLVEIILGQDEFEMVNLQHIKSYTTPVSQDASTKPRLYLPSPGPVIFVAFDHAVLVISLSKRPESPGSQARFESQPLSKAYEDVIDFRKDLNLEIVGSGMEEPEEAFHQMEDSKSRRHKAKYPAIVLQVRGGGVLRVSATNTARFKTSKPQQITAKSKLEQAIFFGTLEQNPLSFAVRSELRFPSQEIGQAALQLSTEILTSATPYIVSVAASIEQNLRKRSAALRDLAEYLKSSGAALDRVTRWQLLWDAEKMFAATLMWKRYDASIRDKPAGSKRTLVTEVVESIHENYKTEPVPEAGELDRVRQWFMKDINQLHMALPWAFQIIKYEWQDGQKDLASIAESLSQADDFVLSAIQGAFEFRAANLELYGLGNEILEYGRLNSGFEGLPEIWTSNYFLTENLRKQVQLAGIVVSECMKRETQDGPSDEVLDKLRYEYPSMIDAVISSNTERILWSSAQDDQQLRSQAGRLQEDLYEAQQQQVEMLAGNFELVDEAMDLAEKHKMLPTLAYILQSEVKTNSAVPGGSDRLPILQDRVRHCFEKFGEAWAAALYESEIQDRSMRSLFDAWPEQQKYLTSFLRSNSQYGKLSWINDIVQEEDFVGASKTLVKLGLHKEDDVWSKKIELSLGKLALLAGQKQKLITGQSEEEGQNAEIAEAQDQLELIRIQDHIYDFIHPIIAEGIDVSAERELALEVYGKVQLSREGYFYDLLDESILKLVKHQALSPGQLIDLLTLMHESSLNEPLDSSDDFMVEKYYLALKASTHGQTKEDQVLTQRIILRRCMLIGDWAEVNNTEEKHDEQVEDQLRRTPLYQTFRSCFKNRLFEKNPSIKTIKPKDVFGAGINEVETRFSKLDPDTLERLRRDMQYEDDDLRSLMKYRIEHWFQTALELAKDDVEKEVAAEMQDSVQMRLAEAKLEEIEQEIREREQFTAGNLLHSTPLYKSNGKVNGNPSNFQSMITYVE